MGTPDFAVPSLEILLDAGYNVVGVVTAPDKPGGRGMKQMLISPVKSFALSRGLVILQPANLKSKDFIKELLDLNADLNVVVAFRMLPEKVWNMPARGSLNLHGSLLPAYRGAAPIQWAIIHGETITGLTTFFLQHEIDTGHIIKQREIPILAEDTFAILHDRMMMSGAGLVLGSVDLIAKEDVIPLLQDHSRSSHAPKINHSDGRIDWDKSANSIYNLIRGLSPYPGAWTLLDGIEWKILQARILSNTLGSNTGELTFAGKKLIVNTKEGELEIREVQLAGKRRMTALEFINGYKIKDWSVS